MTVRSSFDNAAIPAAVSLPDICCASRTACCPNAVPNFPAARNSARVAATNPRGVAGGRRFGFAGNAFLAARLSTGGALTG